MKANDVILHIGTSSHLRFLLCRLRSGNLTEPELLHSLFHDTLPQDAITCSMEIMCMCVFRTPLLSVFSSVRLAGLHFPVMYPETSCHTLPPSPPPPPLPARNTALKPPFASHQPYHGLPISRFLFTSTHWRNHPSLQNNRDGANYSPNRLAVAERGRGRKSEATF